MRTLASSVLTVALGWLLVTSSAHAEPPPDGQALYVRHCEPCHGVTGRGNGPDASLFLTPPRDLQSGFLDRYPIDDLVRRIRSGVPLQLALDLPALRARATDVEAIAAYLRRLPDLDWRVLEEGEAVYLDRCELCHGRDGKPELTLPEGGRSPRNLGDPELQRTMADAEIANVVRHGRGGMPAATPPIPERELPALIAFVRLLSPGYALYDRYCAACHGDDGRGAGSFAEADERPTVVFDRAYFGRRDPEQVRTAIWHMLDTKRPAMPHFRHVLSEAEVRAIIVYLKRGQ